jgi:hypothetical protein
MWGGYTNSLHILEIEITWQLHQEFQTKELHGNEEINLDDFIFFQGIFVII